MDIDDNAWATADCFRRVFTTLPDIKQCFLLQIVLGDLVYAGVLFGTVIILVVAMSFNTQ